MKHYCVTYYDGKGELYMYVQAKSINAAKAAANDLLRKNKTIGAAVRKAERINVPSITLVEDVYYDSRKECQPVIKKMMHKYDLCMDEDYCAFVQEVKEYIRHQVKSKPFRASEVARIIKERR